ncbi:MAG: glycoside hydrolase family 38 C-terminal domain-containing protein [Archaeoglobaceae archaeon]
MENKKKNENEEEKLDQIFLVPHTHYDAMWVFTKEDYFYINIDLILKKVIELLDKYDDYKFTIEQTFLLEEVELRYPELFSKVKEYIKQGRLEIADGEYLMADTMVPQEETLIREILVGKKYVKKKFGVDVPVMWQADSFGLNAQLPQIYRKSGYKWLAFRRGCPENKPTEFLWEGLDGTKIISHWMPLGYRAGLNLDELGKSYRELKRLSFTSSILMPSGSGVTMPQASTSQKVKEWNENNPNKIKIAIPTEFFTDLEKKMKDVPVRKGEMFSGRYSEVFPDCSSSRIWIKKNLRRYENWLLYFERFMALHKALNGTWPYMEELQDFWKKVLFLGFHDVVPGTGMDSAYDDVREYIGFLKTKLSYLSPKVLHDTVETDSMDAEDTMYGDVVVFNPLSWEASNWVEVDLNFLEGDIKKIGGLKNGEEEINIEILRFTRYEDGSLKYARIGFIPTVPPMGYKAYKVMEKKPRKKDKDSIKIRGNTIETNYLKVRFYPDSGLVDVFKDGDKICTANNLVLDEEIGDLYYHKKTLGYPLKTESGEGVKYGSFRMKNFWIDKSPVRRIINIETDYFSLRWPYRLLDAQRPLIWRHNFLRVRKKIIIYKNLPRIDFSTVVRDDHPRIRLRVKFSTDMNLPEYQCETQFGTVNRPTNQYYFNPEGWKETPSGVFPSVRWVDYSDGNKGVTVINRGNPENEVRDGEVYITLLRAVGMLSSDGSAGPAIPVPDARELKTYSFRYSVYPHKGDWKKAQSYHQGYEFNYELIGKQIPRNKKFRVKRSFLSIEPDNVVMTALKPAEDKSGIVLRFYEASGEDTDTSISFFIDPQKVVKTDLMEEEQEEVTCEDGVVKMSVKPFEIVTLKFVLE